MLADLVRQGHLCMTERKINCVTLQPFTQSLDHSHSITSLSQSALHCLLLCNTEWPVNLTTSEALIIILVLARAKFRSQIYIREQPDVGDVGGVCVCVCVCERERE